ncbi:MAG: sulfur oxidation c-type cytochrome SoxX [Alphaproteobacteria bacterium]|nr:sulfur oxidation c-type cytochrome SoxX [Alphaproteobacteria bacterium]MBU1280096.1 sulfur oxidation c-type cytochrome SoxX [Alphaproteobacteria bacterium]MBU1571858.1 sulfur oxidation c-type cytochrome SoxX [Alphaproteobacteria bacterium]MBU1828670.1 sulfur oxidation c-type cytochrome SoxX [Alphaproteobacteria bacterium]MBU2079905.1 sulfur oxidation c-type cytochrome SoxX [Alphaproteobacteria bacterium]
MKRIATCFVALGLTASAAMAEVAPGSIQFEEGAVAQSLTGTAGNPAEGRTIMTTKSVGNCVSCHAATDYADVPFPGEVGPLLDGAGSRWTEAELRGLVVNPKMTFEGTVMPAFYKVDGFTRPGDAFTGKAAPADLPPLLSAQQVEDVVAYLMTLKDE